MSNEWFRSWHGAPVDPKWRTIAKRAQVPTSLVVAFMWGLMDRASQAEDRGSFAGVDLETFADFLDCTEDELGRIVTQCDARNVTCDGRFVSWSKRQPKREDDSSAERTRLWRERKKNQTTYDDVTQCDAVKRNVTLDKIREDISTKVDNTPREPSAREVLLECLSEKTATDLIAHRQAKRAKLTPRAARELVNAFQKFGDPEAAAAEMILRGWTGFKPDWMVQATSPPGSNITQFGKPKERDLRNVPDAMLSADDYWKKRKQLKEWA